MGKLSNLWKRWNKEGVRIPFVHDPVNTKPSVTLLFAYISFCIASISLVCLHFWPDITTATWTSIGFWSVATILYMFRKLQKAKFDFSSQSVELESAEETPKEDSSAE